MGFLKGQTIIIHFTYWIPPLTVRVIVFANWADFPVYFEILEYCTENTAPPPPRSQKRFQLPTRNNVMGTGTYLKYNWHFN